MAGWTFRTGVIDPERLPRLLIEFEVMQVGIPSASQIGVIQLPVTEEREPKHLLSWHFMAFHGFEKRKERHLSGASRQFLTNPHQLFKNIWLPLVNVKACRAPLKLLFKSSRETACRMARARPTSQERSTS